MPDTDTSRDLNRDAAIARQAPGRPATASAGERRDEPALLPPVDVIEDATGITVLADLPGVPKDQLQLRVDGDQLTIEGEVRLPLPAGLEPSLAEVQLSRYRRSFTLSKELDSEHIAAEMSHGVLRLRIPKAAHAQPRRISVQVA